MYGTLDADGDDSVSFFVSNDDIFADINGRITTTRDCTILNVPCCAVLNTNNQIIYVKTIEIPKKITLRPTNKKIKR
jgi:hypothetical protein